MALWHGRILPSVFYFRHRDVVVITSDNFDGEWTAKIIHRLGYTTARGSTSRNAVRAALRAKRRMEEGHPVGITVDGPRGPAMVAQPGAVWMAKVTGNPILPFHVESSSYWTAPSWDASQIPYPFSRIAMVMGAPFYVPADADARGRARRARVPSECAETEGAGPPGGLMLVVSSPRFADHLTPPGHPESPERADVLEAVAAACQGARRRGDGAACGDTRRGAARAHGVPRRCHRGHAGTREHDRRRHVHLPRHRRCRAAGRGRGCSGGRGRAGAWRSAASRRGCPGTAPGTPCRGRPRHGILLLQQRRRRRGACPIARGVARRCCRLRRAPRQRHAGDVL